MNLNTAWGHPLTWNFISNFLALVALVISIWTLYQTRRDLRRESALAVYREVSSIVDCAIRITGDIEDSFLASEGPESRVGLWEQLATLRATFRDNETRLEHQLHLYFGEDISEPTLRLIRSFSLLDRGANLKAIKASAEKEKDVSLDLVYVIEYWCGGSDEDFTSKDKALRWKMLKKVEGRAGVLLEQKEIERRHKEFQGVRGHKP